MKFLKNIQKNNTKSFQIGLLLLTTGSVLILFFRVSQLAEKTTVSELLESPTPTRTAKVTAVFDGDTIGIDTGEKVRYIGIDAPEVETWECFATEAAKFNESLVMGKTVKLVSDTSKTDKYGRLLMYVYLGDSLVNNELVKYGYAKVMTIKPDIKFESVFVTSEKFAKVNNLGLWGECGE